MTTAPELVLDLDRFEVKWRGQRIRPTRDQMKLLHALASRPGWLKTRSDLLDVLNDEGNVYERCIDAHLKRIRKKFRAVDPEFGQIETIHGVGYRWRDDA